MSRRSFVSPAVATLLGAAALSAAATAVAASSGPRVTVRIEGARRTLLATRTVRVPASGSITKYGAPKGSCPADSAAGALNVATRGRWGGSFSTKYDDYLITRILGDTESGTRSYWEILVDNVPASTGACEVRLKSGAQLLFAAVPLRGTGQPLVIHSPSRAVAGSSLNVTVDAVNGKGKSIPLAGAILSDGGATAKTNSRGLASLAVPHRRFLTLRATKTGYVRAAAVRVNVGS